MISVLAYLQNGDYNVIIVDWGKLARNLNYAYAVHYVKYVGKYVALAIDFLLAHGMNPNTTTLIGHSLGAHVIGLAGFYAQQEINFLYGEYLIF